MNFFKKNGTWLLGCALLCLSYNLYFLFLLPQVELAYLIYLDVLIAVCLAMLIAGKYMRYRTLQREKQNLLAGEYMIWQECKNMENMDIIRHDLSILEEKFCEQFERNCELQDYIAKWCHEVKTPLAAAMLLVEKMEDTEEKRELQEQVESINLQLKSALLGCKLQSSLFDLQIGRVELVECVRTSLRNNQFFLIRRQIRLDIQVEDMAVHTDKSWLVYVLDQLIDNAVKYCNDEPVIKIWSCREEAQVLLYMEDNGDGICEKDLRRIFEKGYTGINYHNGRYKSTGMGLYMVSLILDKLGHDIQVESTYGQYTRFTIALPADR